MNCFSDVCKAVQSFDLLPQITKNGIFVETTSFCLVKELHFIAKKFLFWWNVKTTPIQ